MSFDLRRAEPSRAGALTRLIVGLSGLFVLLAILVATGVDALQSIDDDIGNAAYDFSASRPGFVDFLDVVAIVFSNLWCGVALALGAAVVLPATAGTAEARTRTTGPAPSRRQGPARQGRTPGHRPSARTRSSPAGRGRVPPVGH
jgi:preprotein translocase subunit SecG